MSTSIQHQTFPLVSDVHFVAHHGARGPFILARFLDDHGSIIAQSVVESDRLDSFGRDAMSIAAACRAEDPKVVPIGRMPRTRSCLMPAIGAEAQQQPVVVASLPHAQGHTDNPTGLIVLLGVGIGTAISAAAMWLGGVI